MARRLMSWAVKGNFACAFLGLLSASSNNASRRKQWRRLPGVGAGGVVKFLRSTCAPGRGQGMAEFRL